MGAQHETHDEELDALLACESALLSGVEELRRLSGRRHAEDDMPQVLDQLAEDHQLRAAWLHQRIIERGGEPISESEAGQVVESIAGDLVGQLSGQLAAERGLEERYRHAVQHTDDPMELRVLQRIHASQRELTVELQRLLDEARSDGHD